MKFIKLYFKELLSSPLYVIMTTILPLLVGVIIIWLFDSTFMILIGWLCILFGVANIGYWLFVSIPNIVRFSHKKAP